MPREIAIRDPSREDRGADIVIFKFYDEEMAR